MHEKVRTLFTGRPISVKHLIRINDINYVCIHMSASGWYLVQ